MRCHSIDDVTRVILKECDPNSRASQTNIELAATVKLLERYFDSCGIFTPKKLSTLEERISKYRCYLHKSCGFSTPTINAHCLIVSRLITRFNKKGGWDYLSKIKSKDIEDFLCNAATKVGRDRLRHIAAHLRTFLRFLVMRGEIPAGIEKQVDTPHVYNEERLPRTLPWKTVQELLNSIDRTVAIGKRDYAMLLLIATYGLRASEVVRLRLEDIEWKANRIRILQKKRQVCYYFH